MIWGKAVLGTTAAALVCALPSTAAAGIADPDPGFGSGGTVTLPFADETTPPVIESAPDGDLILAGSIRPADGDADTLLVRLNPDGTPDEGFSDDGVLALDLGEGQDDRAMAVAVRQNGAVVVLADANDRFALEQILADGSPDDEYAGEGAIAFGFGTLDQGNPSDVVLDADGRAVVVGSAEMPETGWDAVAARLTTGGALDSSFDGDGKVEVTSCSPEQTVNYLCGDHGAAVHVEPDGDIHLAGTTDIIPRSRSFYAVLSSSGAVEEVEDGFAAFRDASSFADGSALLVGGSADYRVDGTPTARAVHRSLTGVEGNWSYVPPTTEAVGAAELADVAVLRGDQAIASGWLEAPRGAERHYAFFLIRPEWGFVETALADDEIADVAAVSTGGFVSVGQDASDWTVRAFLEPTVAAPQTRIVAGPRGRVHQRPRAFRFRATADASQFECKLDRRRWRACDSPERVGRLREGVHRFRARAVASGEVDRSPATRRFRIR